MKIILMKLKYMIVALAVLLPPLAQAQERLTGLHGNTVIQQFLQRNPNSDVKLKSQTTTEMPSLWLPFFDDFTYDAPYPDSMRWEDKFAFVNTSFQKNPVNRGVATLDLLDAEGKIYDHASPYPFIADYLTSRPIRTDSIILNDEIRRLTAADSLYLSFYYQPQGMGDAPNRYDSLLLEFFMEYADTTILIDSIYHPADTLWINDLDHEEGYLEIIEAYFEYTADTLIYPEKWRHIWASPGMSIDSFYSKNGQWMMPVMIPIVDEDYFRSDFRFRFRNYASLPNNTLPSWQSNMDQWNIDYVYLNHNRTKNDKTYQDVSFVNPGASFLVDYTAMPHWQYAANPSASMTVRDTINNTYRLKTFETSFVNLDDVSHDVTYKYRIYNPDGNQAGTDDKYKDIEWTKPIASVDSVGIQTTDVPVMMFPAQEGTFTVKQTLTGDSPRFSDSITFSQVFEDYYAYDDGTPEAGYGLTPAKAMLAVRFSLNTRDRLKAVDIFFNTTPQRQSPGHIEYFTLMVWDGNQTPGDTALYAKEEILYGNEAGKFIRFPVSIADSLVSSFFVGVQQSTADNINIGFDYSNNMSERNMYKIFNNPWQKSDYEGSIMIRPVMGAPQGDTIPPAGNPAPKNIIVYPNPLSSGQQIHVKRPESFDNEHEITLKIYDGIGKQCYQAPYTQEEITLENVYNGVFIIKLYNHTTGETATTKLMISR
jgi:hypothetical protein